MAVGRIKCGMNKQPIEKIIQGAELKGKDSSRAMCVGILLRTHPLPLILHRFSSSTQCQVADLLVLINSPNAGKPSRFQLSASLGFHGKGSEGVMPGIAMSGGGAAGEVTLPA